MNFLETDFKRRRVPKRSITFTDKAGNLTAFRLDKYPSFLRKVSSLINEDRTDYSILVSRGTYTSNLSNNLSEVVTKSALKTLEESREIINSEIETLIIELFTKHEKDQEIFFQEYWRNRIIDQNPCIRNREHPLFRFSLFGQRVF